MIAFADLPRHIRISRVEAAESGGARTMLGRIAKTTFEIEPALQEQLVAGEHAEVEAIIHGYRTAQTDHRRAEALGLPNTLRELMEHFETDATETERAFVASALMEAVRRLRRFQRGA